MAAEMFASAKAAALGLVRRGPRTIVWTPHHVQLGNLLYYWLNAHLHQQRGESRFALETERSKRWHASFPELFDTLVVPRDEVKIMDRRLEQHPLQNFGVDFTADDLRAFITGMLLDTQNDLTRALATVTVPTDLVINIRRGDYYSVPRWRGEYSFDVVEYVRAAVTKALEQAPVNSITLVSDDLDWCRIKLAWLTEIAPVSEPPDGASPLAQLAILASAPRLILTNSTFGYWGGYIADALRDTPDPGTTGTWAPAFHSRAMPGGRANQLSPGWNIIESIPGGWDG